MQINIILVFFIYGLAFFSMGLAMMMESGRSPLLADSSVLRPLAVFGFVHGTHEWLEMVLINNEWFEVQYSVQVAWFRMGILAVSFLPLIAFGLRVLSPEKRWRYQDLSLGALFILLFLGLVGLTAGFHSVGLEDLIAHTDALARYSLAVPGALLAALALHRQAGRAREGERRKLASSLEIAAVAFGIYALSQIFVPRLDIFPANLINAQAFTDLTGLPVQVIRAGMAVTITISLIQATQIVEEERKRQFTEVQNARLEALEQIRRDLIERENMRRELLRHTVTAQEDERARIARELHDETAQILTAFSLNLATLGDMLAKESRASELLGSLKNLSREMSLGIYRLVRDLRPAQLDDLGLAAALEYLTEEEKKRTGLEVTFEVRGRRQRLDPLVETVFFRVAQEALTNVSRHARTDSASIDLVYHPQHANLRISDRGAGFDPGEELRPPHGWGLAGMQERVESIGGQFRIDSAPGKGTLVEVSVPFQERVKKIHE